MYVMESLMKNYYLMFAVDCNQNTIHLFKSLLIGGGISGISVD